MAKPLRATTMDPALDAQFLDYCEDRGVNIAEGLRNAVRLLLGVRTVPEAPEIGPEPVVPEVPGEQLVEQGFETPDKPVKVPESPIRLVDDALRYVRTLEEGAPDATLRESYGLVLRGEPERCRCPEKLSGFGVRCPNCFGLL